MEQEESQNLEQNDTPLEVISEKRVIEKGDCEHEWEFVEMNGDLKDYRCKFCSHGKSLRDEFKVIDGKIKED